MHDPPVDEMGMESGLTSLMELLSSYAKNHRRGGSVPAIFASTWV